jgi:hypothetical protein
MAMTKIAEPFDFAPAYNPLMFIYNSTNKNKLGFKYIFQVFQSGTATKIGEYKVLPRFNDGYGQIDISKLLQSKVSIDFDITNLTLQDANNTYYKYDVKIGEEYTQGVAYSSSLTNNAGFVQITSATHTFVSGDQVSIKQADNGIANPLIEGLFVVKSVQSSTQFTISAIWSNVNNATIDGNVYFADNRKTQTLAEITESDKYVFNGVRTWKDYTTYNENQYLIDGTGTQLFVTDLPTTGFSITPNQNLWLNIANDFIDTDLFCEILNSDGDQFIIDIDISKKITQICIGVDTIPTSMAGTLPIIKSNTTFIQFQLFNSGLDPQSVQYTIDIDQRCRINEYDVYFMDRMGSVASFGFSLKSYENGNVTRQSFNKVNQGFVSGSMWNYATTEFGQTAYSMQLDKTFELNTDWMSEEMNVYFEQLVTSPITFVRFGDEYISCVITDTSFEVNRRRNKNLIRKTITIKLANQNTINV